MTIEEKLKIAEETIQMLEEKIANYEAYIAEMMKKFHKMVGKEE